MDLNALDLVYCRKSGSVKQIILVSDAGYHLLNSLDALEFGLLI